MNKSGVLRGDCENQDWTGPAWLGVLGQGVETQTPRTLVRCGSDLTLGTQEFTGGSQAEVTGSGLSGGVLGPG